jgi:hypothetical protein
MHDRIRSSTGGDRFPGYDVLGKWSSQSWNAKTREVVGRRLAVVTGPLFFSPGEFAAVHAISGRIVPQPVGRVPIPIAALVDRRLHSGIMDGYRVAGMPRDGEAWRLGLKALDAEAHKAYGEVFARVAGTEQDMLLRRAQCGKLDGPDWADMRPQDFFKRRMARDVVLAYYSHPAAWSEIGWGGPASPRGYVRLDFNERDPWEPAEAKPGEEAAAFRINRHVR